MISKVLGGSIAIIIVVVNLLLKMIIVSLSVWVGEETQCKQKSLIKDSIFYAQFFNTAFIILLVNANLGERSFVPGFIKSNLNGPFYDYYPEWYNDVGLKILQTMVINAVVPLGNIVTPYVMLYAQVRYDSSNTFDPYNTKSTSLAQYKKMYGQIDYLIHFRYSDALKTTYITMMYGLGIPLLFPLAALSFLITLIGEKIQCAYFVKLPPAMGDTLTSTTISALNFSPILLLFNGYWMISNKQIFENKWNYIQVDGDPMKSSHHVDHFDVNWASPLLIMAIAATFILVTQIVFSDLL